MKANQYIREVETVFKTNAKMKVTIKSPQDAYNLFSDIRNSTQEKLIAVHLAVDNNVSCFQVVHVGTMDGALCNPADIFRTALLTGAVSLIVIHNHPSGRTEPSKIDKEVFHKIKEAAELFGIRVFDFIIVGEDTYYSASESGILDAL